MFHRYQVLNNNYPICLPFLQIEFAFSSALALQGNWIMFDSISILGGLNEYLLGMPSSNRSCFSYCKTCQRSFNHFSKKGQHSCGLSMYN